MHALEDESLLALTRPLPPSHFQPINQTTFYTLLRDAGYAVMTSGKDDLTKATGMYLNGTYHADALGFTSYARCDGKQDAAGTSPHDPYGAYCAANSEVVNGTNSSFWQIYNKDMHSCGSNGYDCEAYSPLPQIAYEDNWVADNTVHLLESKPKGQPWFLQVSFPGPHPPFVVTASMASASVNFTYPLPVDMGDVPVHVAQVSRQDYAAELINLDHLFGKVLAAIPADERENLIIIIASDHGEMLGASIPSYFFSSRRLLNLLSLLPRPPPVGDHSDWSKSQPWNGAASVPLVILGPGLPAGASVTVPVSTMDIAGTVLDFAGLKPAPGMTTQSLRPLLGRSGTYRSYVSSGLGAWRSVAMLRPDGTNLKLVCCHGQCPGQPRNDSTVFIAEGDEDEYAGVVRGRAAASSSSSAAKDTMLLFDLDADPFDMNNLVNERPKAAGEMKELLPPGWCHN